MTDKKIKPCCEYKKYKLGDKSVRSLKVMLICKDCINKLNEVLEAKDE